MSGFCHLCTTLKPKREIIDACERAVLTLFSHLSSASRLHQWPQQTRNVLSRLEAREARRLEPWRSSRAVIPRIEDPERLLRQKVGIVLSVRAHLGGWPFVDERRDRTLIRDPEHLRARRAAPPNVTTLYRGGRRKG